MSTLFCVTTSDSRESATIHTSGSGLWWQGGKVPGYRVHGSFFFGMCSLDKEWASRVTSEPVLKPNQMYQVNQWKSCHCRLGRNNFLFIARAYSSGRTQPPVATTHAPVCPHPSYTTVWKWPPYTNARVSFSKGEQNQS